MRMFPDQTAGEHARVCVFVAEEGAFAGARWVLLGLLRGLASAAAATPPRTAAAGASGLIVPTSARPMSVITHAVFTLPWPAGHARSERTFGCAVDSVESECQASRMQSFPVGPAVGSVSYWNPRVKKTQPRLRCREETAAFLVTF